MYATGSDDDRSSRGLLSKERSNTTKDQAAIKSRSKEGSFRSRADLMTVVRPANPESQKIPSRRILSALTAPFLMRAFHRVLRR